MPKRVREKQKRVRERICGVRKRVHKRVHKRVRKSTTEMPSIIAIKPYPACLGLATSHERFIAWGIELP